MSIQIGELRLTFIWVETNLAMLESAAPSEFPFGFLASDADYKQKFDDLKNGLVLPGGLSAPWPQTSGNRFWMRYFGGRPPNDIEPGTAWKYLTPFRTRPTLQIRPAWTDDRKACQVTWEGYFHPFGFSLALTAYLRGNYTLEQAVTAAHQVYRQGDYVLTTSGGGSSSGRLSSAASAGLDTLQSMALGPKGTPGIRMVDPLSLVTVVRGDGVEAKNPLAGSPDQEAIQRFLEASCNWQNSWQTVKLPALTDPGICLDNSSTLASEGDVLYASRRPDGGRVVWFPGRFSLGGSNSALGCYHRNLAQGMLQTASLAYFSQAIVGIAAPGLAAGQCAKNAARILRDLYDDPTKKRTYRSGALRAQIEQGGFKPVIDQLCTRYNL